MTSLANQHCVVLGAHGQVGQALCCELKGTELRADEPQRDESECGELTKVENPVKLTALTRTNVDASDLASVESHIREINLQTKVDYLFNAVAYTAVDKAEDEREQADMLNHKLPALLATLSQELGFKLVHYSTDYVYPGSGEQAYSESSPTGPLNVYGKSKLAGDLAVQTIAPNALIGRTSWVYDKNGKNFKNTMLRLASSHKQLRVVDDQIGAPTPAKFIAQMSLKLLTSAQSNASGVFHLVPSGYTSWAGFARAIFKLHDLDVSVEGIATSKYPTPAQRPLNSRLSNQKLAEALNQPINDWQTELENL